MSKNELNEKDAFQGNGGWFLFRTLNIYTAKEYNIM